MRRRPRSSAGRGLPATPSMPATPARAGPPPASAVPPVAAEPPASAVPPVAAEPPAVPPVADEPPRVPSVQEYFARWSRLHGGYDPRGSPFVRPWLTVTYRIARHLVGWRVPADAVTLLGLLGAAVVVGLAGIGGRWLLLASVVTVFAGLLDNLDGAVAILGRGATRWGFVLDSVADRVADALLALSLYVAGGPGWACMGWSALSLLQEYARARAAATGLDEIGTVTVSERPTRVILPALTLGSCGVLPEWTGSLATAGAIAALTLAMVGLGQLLASLRRTLR